MRVNTATGPVKIGIAVVGCLFAIGVTSTAQAQEFGLTPFAGYRFGGGVVDLETGYDLTLDESLAYGLIFSIPWDAKDRSRLELLWSHQDTAVNLANVEIPALDLDIDYLHIGGSVVFATSNKKVEALLSGGLGATYMRLGLDGAASSQLGFSLSLGGGILYNVTDRVGIRLEARGWYTFTETGVAFVCSGGCLVAFSGSGFGQVELTTGLQLSF
jgi:hypothetical protein